MVTTNERTEYHANNPNRRNESNNGSRPVSELWAAYKSGDESLLEQLCLHYFPLVRRNARRIVAKLPQSITLDDLISAGFFGLWDAVTSFDPTRGVKFETYAAPRIRGSILDDLRKYDVKRTTRRASNRLAEARESLKQSLGRPPQNRELQTFLRFTDNDMIKALRLEALAYTGVSLNKNFCNWHRNYERTLRRIMRVEIPENVHVEIEFKE